MKNKQKYRIGSALRGYLIFPVVIGCVWLALCIALFFINMKAATIVTVVFAVCVIASIIFYVKANKKVISELVNFARSYQGLEKDMIDHFPIPYAIADKQGNILVYSERFGKFCEEGFNTNKIGDIFHEIGTKDLDFEGESQNISVFYDNRSYRLYFKKIVFNRKMVSQKLIALSKGDEFMYVVYMMDETEIVNMTKKLTDEQMAVGVIYIDNYQETLEQANDIKRSLLVAMVDRTISSHFQNINGIVRKLEKDRYFVVLKRKYMATFQRDKFDILDEVKQIETDNDIPITLSIGMGVGDDYAKNSENARLALELALGRGGDQAVVKDGERVYYYGGKTKHVEKNTRVKARVRALAFREALLSKERVVIMGHKTCDIDCLGAAIGMSQAAKALGKRAYIILNDLTNTVRPVLETFQKDPEYNGVFIPTDKADEYVDKDTALVIVDVNKPEYFECPDLINNTKTILLIDHHLQSGDRIEDLSLAYHEPTASSASEMVSELLQYISVDEIKLKKSEAEALYAGILIDTNYFSKNTGVKTFEAAAYLKKCGVDVVKVKGWFSDSLDEVKAKAETIRTAEVVEKKFAIAVCPDMELDNPTVVASQVANELLDVSTIVGSFVLTQIDERVSISARSRGNVNVQKVMERMGGGGHLNMAGAQIEESDTEEVKKRLKFTIRKMIEEGQL